MTVLTLHEQAPNAKGTIKAKIEPFRINRRALRVKQMRLEALIEQLASNYRGAIADDDVTCGNPAGKVAIAGAQAEKNFGTPSCFLDF